MDIIRWLVLNRIREYKRLITNLFMPLISLLIVAGIMLYEMYVYLLPALYKMKNINEKTLNVVCAFFVVYGFYACVFRNHPIVNLKPMTLYLFDEPKCQKLIQMNYIGKFLKHLLSCLFLSCCITGLPLNANTLYIFSTLLLYMESIKWSEWIFYQKETSKKEIIKRMVSWSIMSGLFVVNANIRSGILLALEIIIAAVIYSNAQSRLSINWPKYEEEMKFQDKLLTAQNYNHTVLLSQYSKEKKLRKISHKSHFRIVLKRYPIIWKATTSICRLNMEMIIAGVAVFLMTVAIYFVPFLWKIPLLDQLSIRYMLLMIGMLFMYQISIQSMMKQLDSVIEKEKAGLFIPLSNTKLIAQFTIIPAIVILFLTIIASLVLSSGIIQTVIAGSVMQGIVWLSFYLRIEKKELFKKIYFVVSICILIASFFLIK